jgi:hypothetical protein
MKKQKREWSDAQHARFDATIHRRRAERLRAQVELPPPLIESPNPNPIQPQWIIYRDRVYRRIDNEHLIKVIK